MNETITIRQTKFNNGEVAPSSYGEVTHPKYASSVKLCQNWLPVPQGALVKRPATKLVGTVKDASYAPRLIPFMFSDERAFLLEFGNLYIRFYRQAQYVGVDGNLHKFGDSYVGGYYEIATPFTTAMLPYLKWAQVGNTITICYGGQASGTAAIAPQDLTHTTNANTPWVISATPLKIPNASVPSAPVCGIILWSALTTYNAGDMVTDANGGLWTSLFGPNLNHALPSPVVLNAAGTGVQGSIFWMPANDTSHQAVTSSWVSTTVVQDPNGITYESGPSAAVSFSGPLSSDRAIPLTISSAVFPAGWTVLYNRVYRAPSNGVYGWIADTQSGSATYRDTGAAPNFTIQPPQGLDPFLVNAADSYPAVIGYLDQRRVWFNSLLLPATMFFSKVGDLYNYDSRNSPGSDADAFNLTLSSEVLESTRAFVPKRRGLILTSQGEWAIAGATGGPVSRSSFDVRKQSDWGASWVPPVKIGTGIVFNTSKSNMVRDLYPLYGLYADIWDGQDLSVLARHLFDLHTLKDMGFQSTPYPIVWCARDDGLLMALTYAHAPPSFGQQLSEGVAAWSQHPTGTSDAVEWIAVVPEPPDDAVYLEVKRGTSRFIERMESPVPPASPFRSGVPDVRYGRFLDCSVSYDGHNLDATAKASIVSVLHPGSSDPADYLAGSQVTVTVGVATPFSGADVVSPNGVTSDFYFDPENLNGQGVAYGKVVGLTSAQVVTVELNSSLTAAQIATWKAGNANWALARGFIFATHLTLRALDSNSATGTRGVTCLVDGNVATPDIWAAGLAWLPQPGIVILLGLGYNADMAPLSPSHPSAEIRNKLGNVVRVGFEVAYARDLWVGADASTLVQWTQRQVPDAYGVIQPQTGYFEEFVPGDWNKDKAILVRHWQPLPATLATILREIRLGDT